LHLNVGDVILWHDFPYPKSGDIKDRWFIYLGRTPIFSMPVFAFLCTTTTQAQHFAPGGDRSSHSYKRFDVCSFPQFEQDCILDYDEELHSVTEETVDRCQAQIEHRGQLDKNTMRNIYKQYSRPGVVSPIILRDIASSFNQDGIEGLKRPK
jgi:hypothetical protein